MAATEAIVGYGATIHHRAVNTTAAYVLLDIEIQTLPLPEDEADDIDVTHMTSPNRYREYLPGLIEGGEIELECNWTADGYTACRAIRNVVKEFKITLSNLDTIEFDGYIKKVAAEAMHDDKVGMTIGIKVASDVTFTP